LGENKMALDSKVKELLNKFADSQIALNIPGLPADQSKIKIGDLLDEAHGAVRSASVSYSFGKDGGVIGSIRLDGHLVPAGAIITRAWIAEKANLTGGVGAEIDVKIGATSLTGGPQLLAAIAGVKESVADFTATLPEASSGGSVVVDVSVAALTAGQLLIAFEYIDPV
jgi:hypothetical protein